MKSRNDLALKEWAVVVEALLAGRQTVILRKGGIAEDPKGPFAVEDREFWLYPTFTHQDEKSLKEDCRGGLLAALSRKPAPGTLILPAYAEVLDARPLRSPDELPAFDGAHIWSESYLRTRWAWKPEQPIWAITLKIRRREPPVSLPERPEYGGCKSWVRLAEPVPTEGLTTTPSGT